MSMFSLRRQFFGGIRCFSKLPVKISLISLLTLVHLSFSVLAFAADIAAENSTVGTADTPQTAKSPELSTYKLEVGDSFVVTVDGYPEYSKERIPVPVQQDGYGLLPAYWTYQSHRSHGF